MTIYVPKKHATFVHVPKNAGTSISNWLLDYCGGKWVGKRSYGAKHADIHRAESLLGHGLGDIIVVARNPWDRVVSAYHYYQHKASKPNDFLGMSFEEFVKSRNFGCVNRPTTSYYTKADFLLRFERLEKDFKAVQDYFGRHSSLMKKNNSPHKNYRGYYTDSKMVDIVAEKHAADIEAFGYQFDPSDD
jgi:hypothetical protein